MSSGNPMGLSEISHFGSFQRVGGKAGGFINKKFFHPSSIRNQERLWKAQTEDDRETRKQQEMQKRRDEERQVEELRKQMYLSGQGKSSDFLSSAAEASAATSHLGSSEKLELKQAIAAQQKRRALLKQASKAAKEAKEGSDEEGQEGQEGAGGAPASPVERKLAKSKYPEDVLENGHTEVWGSWYSVEDSTWGFSCCKLRSRSEACPHAEPEEEPKSKKSRKKASQKEVPESAQAEPSGAEGAGAEGSGAPEAPEAPAAPQPVIDAASLLDTRMLEAAAKRQRVKSFKEMQQASQASKEDAQRSQYFEELLQDPSAG
mmetsp:Transcript_33757/g.75806  ORF Transcript_33757/g.75806 Transcript_33757/m.75806 type:complete len:318 (-) Transcript_33757:90-1043(-)